MSNYTMSPVVNGEKKQMIVKVGDTQPIGTIVDYDGAEVPNGWEEVADGMIHATNNADYTIQADDTYERFPTKTSIVKKGDFTLDTTTGIITATKSGTLEISGNINFNSISASGTKWVNLYVGGANKIVENSYGVQGQRLTLTIAPMLIEVTANTNIYMQIYGKAGDVIRSTNGVYSYITCKYV